MALYAWHFRSIPPSGAKSEPKGSMDLGASRRFARRTLAMAAGATAVLFVSLAQPAVAGPAEDCLADRGDPKAALAACDQVARIVRFSTRGSKRSNPNANPA